MKYYLSIDSGGTKVAAALFDEQLRRVAAAVSGSLRSNTTGAHLIDSHFSELVGMLGIAGKRIETVSGTCENTVTERLRAVCDIGQVRFSGEFDMGLSAAGIFGDGLLALCGTGATVFGRANGKAAVSGGYGAAVSDEGSGYWIGRQACIAAIRDAEGRGEHTSLSDAIPQKLGFAGKEELREAIFSIYSDTDRSPTASVARLAPAVIAEAEKGDEAAQRIIVKAAELMYSQLVYVADKCGAGGDVPVTVSGSVWRGAPLLSGTFTGLVGKRWPDKPIRIPVTEPVLGPAAKMCYEKYGRFGIRDAEELAAQFPEFSYDINKNK